MSDITVYDQYFCIFPKESKPGRDRRGTNVLIAKNNTAFILIHEHYVTLLTKQTTSQPGRATFCHGRWGTHVKSLLHFSPSLDFCQFCGLSPERNKAHSFRIGAATTAVLKTPVLTLKAMGRWSSAS